MVAFLMESGVGTGLKNVDGLTASDVAKAVPWLRAALRVSMTRRMTESHLRVLFTAAALGAGRLGTWASRPSARPRMLPPPRTHHPLPSLAF